MSRMRTILYTGYDAPYTPLASLTVPRMVALAAKHGIEFQAFDEPPPGLNIYWTGVARGLKFLREGYERIIYLDVDQMITNPDKAPWLSVGTSGFHASKDWGADAVEPWHFSMCGFVAHRDCIGLFENVLTMEPDWQDKPFQEQGPFRELVRQMMADLPHMRELKPGEPNNGLINIHPRKLFNCVPDEVSPGNVPEPWRPGDFAKHITMLPIGERVLMAQQRC